jgi:hypothetical protein
MPDLQIGIFLGLVAAAVAAVGGSMAFASAAPRTRSGDA